MITVNWRPLLICIVLFIINVGAEDDWHIASSSSLNDFKLLEKKYLSSKKDAQAFFRKLMKNLHENYRGHRPGESRESSYKSGVKEIGMSSGKTGASSDKTGTSSGGMMGMSSDKTGTSSGGMMGMSSGRTGGGMTGTSSSETGIAPDVLISIYYGLIHTSNLRCPVPTSCRQQVQVQRERESDLNPCDVCNPDTNNRLVLYSFLSRNMNDSHAKEFFKLLFSEVLPSYFVENTESPCTSVITLATYLQARHAAYCLINVNGGERYTCAIFGTPDLVLRNNDAVVGIVEIAREASMCLLCASHNNIPPRTCLQGQLAVNLLAFLNCFHCNINNNSLIGIAIHRDESDVLFVHFYSACIKDSNFCIRSLNTFAVRSPRNLTDLLLYLKNCFN